MNRDHGMYCIDLHKKDFSHHTSQGFLMYARTDFYLADISYKSKFKIQTQ